MPEKNQGEIRKSLVAFKKGFKIDQNTGQVDILEYSSFLEKAEDLLNKAGAIKAEIKRRENQQLPERANLSSATLKEIWDDMEDCEKLVKDSRTNETKKKRLKEYVTRLEQVIPEIETRLGLPELQKQVYELTAAVQRLISEDRQTEQVLKNLPKEQFEDTNI